MNRRQVERWFKLLKTKTTFMNDATALCVYRSMKKGALSILVHPHPHPQWMGPYIGMDESSQSVCNEHSANSSLRSNCFLSLYAIDSTEITRENNTLHIYSRLTKVFITLKWKYKNKEINKKKFVTQLWKLNRSCSFA